MRKNVRTWLLAFLICFLFSSCDFSNYRYGIWFQNESSYTISINCDVTNPSSFTLAPGVTLFVDSNVDDASKINIEFNNHPFVVVSVHQGTYAGIIRFRNR